MEQTLGYIIFGTGWPILVVGSIWMWRKVAQQSGPAKTFLNITLAAFYVLGYTCTMYWLGQPWLMGVLPAFIVFFALFIVTVKGVITWSRSGQ